MTETLPRSLLRAKRRAKVCKTTRKQGYRNRSSAMKFAERSTQICGQKLTVYKCRFCGSWHLTKHAPRVAA